MFFFFVHIAAMENLDNTLNKVPSAIVVPLRCLSYMFLGQCKLYAYIADVCVAIVVSFENV